MSTRVADGSEHARRARGASSSLLVVLLACLVALGVLAWSLRGRAASESADAEGPVAGPRTPIEAGVPLETSDDRDGTRSTHASPAATRHSFEGRGVIRGEVVVSAGVAFPARWSLVIEPNPFLEGRERAVTRTVDFEEGERTFRVDDLPLAGYLVRARARGLNHVPANVLLVRGSADQFVTLSFLPAGILDGSVRDSTGAPAVGVDVTLESVAAGERRTVATDGAGQYAFADVVDGTYRLILGDLNVPLLPPESYSFKAPSLRAPERELPPTASLTMTTMTLDGRPRPDTHVFAHAKPRGAFDLRSGPDARAVARYLLPGEYRIEAESPAGEKADVALILDAGVDATIELRLQ